MVCEWGMSEELGPLSFGKKEEQIFLGKEFATHKDYSEETAEKIDREVSRIVRENFDRARTLLSGNIAMLHRMAEELLTKEVLNAEEIDHLIGSFKISGDLETESREGEPEDAPVSA